MPDPARPVPGRPSRSASRVAWALQIVCAAVLGQTLFFKFTAAPESRFIFETLGVEPWGRIASGIAELACVVLLLVPRTAATGAVLALGVMGGAIASHLFVLGIEVQGDGGLLFGLACLVAASAACVAWIRRADLPWIGPRLASRSSR